MILIEGNFIIFIDGKTFFLRQNGAGTMLTGKISPRWKMANQSNDYESIFYDRSVRIMLWKANIT